MAAAQEPLLERDFLIYEKHRQDDPEFNALRLSVRRKLQAIVDDAKKKAAKKGYKLASRATLHHPHSYNGRKVQVQRAYLCRSDGERKKLQAFFGEALGQDAKTHYIGTTLDLCLDSQVLTAGLRIHPQAWWDGEQLKKAVGSPEGMKQWLTLLKALPEGFALKLGDWRKAYWARVANAQEMREYFGSYTPGEHWLGLRRELPREDVLDLGEQVQVWATTSLLSLLEIYRFTLWVP